MNVYKIIGKQLLDRDGKILAYIEDNEVKNSLGRKIGSIDNNSVLDSNSIVIAEINDYVITFPHNDNKGDLNEAGKLIDATGSDDVTLAAFWFLFFVD